MTRVSDSLEPLARALALAAGSDPDARMPKPGTDKTWPAWCGFREQARAQRNAEQAAQAREAAGVLGQDPKYADAQLTVLGPHESSTLDQMATCMKVGNVVKASICADGHLGYAQPVGGVIAYEKQISVSGVGYDIGCGNMAVLLDTKYSDIQNRIPDIRAQICKNVSFGMGRANDTRVEHELFDDRAAWDKSGMGDYLTKARNQLGTVGGGNHYVDLFRDENDHVWIGVHFGSRGLGHTTATRYTKAGGGKDGVHVPPVVFDETSEAGERYIAAMELAGRYAYAGREWVTDTVRKIVGGEVLHTVHNHHNYAWRERHFGKDLWVVRKGCTPAFPGQRGFIGGSMAEEAVIVQGVESPLSQLMLYSTVHGAGRPFGRREAMRRYTKEQMQEWLERAGVVLTGGGVDESPMAYKRLSEVLSHHEGTIQVLHTLKPFEVFMAGGNERDPFKD